MAVAMGARIRPMTSRMLKNPHPNAIPALRTATRGLMESRA
jgi:hypothetical protein